MKSAGVTLFFLLFSLFASAQDNAPFRVTLEPVIPENFTGLQSYAWARSGNRILLAGGRTDGLHRTQPFAALAKKNNNTSLILIDLVDKKVWTKSISSLPATQAEQLQSSNMEFYQDDNQAESSRASPVIWKVYLAKK